MKFSKFTIHNYRGIEGPLVINLAKSSLIPIIGVNESGKTTILKSIFAFDYFNDEANSFIKHLDETSNLYKASIKHPFIVAEIQATKHDLYDALNRVKNSDQIKKSPKSGVYLGIIEKYRNLIDLTPQFLPA